jgi:hypothetical protein
MQGVPVATTQFVFGQLGYISAGGHVPALLWDSTMVCESKTPSASASATTAAAPELGGNPRVACRVATDTAVYVSFGSAPNASTDTDRVFLPAGAIDHFMVKAGDKASVVNA